MIKKLFLPLCLLVATASRSLGATSNFDQWIENNGLKVNFELLADNKKECLYEAFYAAQDLLEETKRKAFELAQQHREAVETLKGLLGAQELTLSISLGAAPKEAPQAVAAAPQGETEPFVAVESEPCIDPCVAMLPTEDDLAVSAEGENR